MRCTASEVTLMETPEQMAHRLAEASMRILSQQNVIEDLERDLSAERGKVRLLKNRLLKAERILAGEGDHAKMIVKAFRMAQERPFRSASYQFMAGICMLSGRISERFRRGRF